jgi:glycosyltransferase involved in cell wall biosynthesis
LIQQVPAADHATSVAAHRGNERPHRHGTGGGASGGGVSVIIPAMNEAANIGWVLERLPEGIEQVIVVDGRSVDGTVDVARSVRPNIKIVYENERGKGAALRAGFAAARRRYVVMLDADGSMDPMEIPRFVKPLRDGWDVVKGSRFLPTGGSSDLSTFRSLGNLGLLLIARLLFGFRGSDLCYGFMAFRREVLPRLGLTATGFEIETQIAVRSHLQRVRVTEVPSFESERRNGRSNLNPLRDGLRVLHTLLADKFRSDFQTGPLGGNSPFARRGVLAVAFSGFPRAEDP